MCRLIMVVIVMSFCEICGCDISDRRSHAIYCEECYRKLNRDRSLERMRNLYEYGLGTTAMGNHTKIRKEKGKIVGIDKEYRIVQNELKKLGLCRYMRRHRI